MQGSKVKGTIGKVVARRKNGFEIMEGRGIVRGRGGAPTNQDPTLTYLSQYNIMKMMLPCFQAALLLGGVLVVSLDDGTLCSTVLDVCVCHPWCPGGEYEYELVGKRASRFTPN